MRFRLLAFLPLAAVITFLILLRVSPFVSVLEHFVTPGEGPSGPVVVTRLETVGKRLFHELHVLSHGVIACAEQSPCDGSPLLCSTALGDHIDHEYQRLRTALHERCDYPLSLIDYAWQRPRESIVERVVGGTCGERHDWLEHSMSGTAEPARYYF